MRMQIIRIHEMLLTKNMHGQSAQLAKTCIRFADRLGLTVIENETLFTIQEALDADDVYWFDSQTMTVDDLDAFIYMCRAYVDINKPHWVPDAYYMLKIDCPNCHRCNMTEEQVKHNKIMITPHETYIICINCGEIMKLHAL